MCFQAEESVKHLFTECLISREIRDYICDALYDNKQHSRQQQVSSRFREGGIALGIGHE
jgi:hypothetical protein